MKKLLLTLLAAALCFSIAFGIAACDDASSDRGSNSAPSGNSEQVYSFSALSAGTLISSMNGGSAAQTAKALGLSSPVNAAAVTDEETVSELNGYMHLVESILSDGAYSVNAEQSDREGYSVKETILYRDMLGNTLEYVLYYNEIGPGAKTAGYAVSKDFDDRDDDDRDDDRDVDRYDDDRDEAEKEYRIEGIMLIDGAEYAVRGEKESETDGDETENETNFTVVLDEAANSYLRVQYSSETETGEAEQEYTYSVYENGTLQERCSLDYEEEHDETEIELGLYDKATGSTTRFFFERDDRNGIIIRVGDRNAAQSYRVTIEADENGGTKYVYEYAGGRLEYGRS